MKSSFLTLILIIFQLSYFSVYEKNNFTSEKNVGNQGDNRIETNQMKITIGSNTFTAKLLDNPTVTEFKSRLPLTIDMSELNGNEKLYRFSTDLPVNPSNPGTINTGDLMIYSSNTLVLFYKSFPTSYSYTKLGRIENTSGLADAVGTGSVTVTFELE
jgi:hypothetical protein